jgi:flavodoxin
MREIDMMKAVVAYSSVYGNTKLVAEAIAELMRVEGIEAELISIDDGMQVTIPGDFMFVGSPTRGGRPTKKARRFLEELNVEAWRNKPIVLFDTVGPLPMDSEKRKIWLSRIDKGAATRMQSQLVERGLSAHPELLHIAVTGFKGPLAVDALDIAKAFAKKFVSGLK